MKLFAVVALTFLVVALAESRVQQRRGLTASGAAGLSDEHPYLFLSVPRGRTGSVLQGFEIIQEDDGKMDDGIDQNDDDDDDDTIEGIVERGTVRAAIGDDNFDENDDDDDDDDDEEEDAPAVVVQGMKNNKPQTTAANLQMILQNAKPTQMMVSKEHAGAIMVPDGIIEIEGQSVIDEKTGKAALLVPQAALDAIPDGSVVALMERSLDDINEEEERANRVIVRRRRRGSRRNVRRRRVNNNRNRRRRVSGNRNRRRRVNRRKNVRVVRAGGNRRRRGNRRRGASRPVVVQG